MLTRIFKNLIISASTLVLMGMLLVNPALAQQVSCPPRYTPITIYGYGISGCLPPTPFGINAITIDSLTMTAMIIIFLAIFAVVVNALILKNKLSR
jgi:hypothetical protein